MTSEHLRQSFLDFFEAKQHTIIPSAPLMPTSPNLLFTNAGMNPFVPYFLGERQAPYPRIADTQKCIRAGGKHNDLEDVGFDTYHQTFFEMLGNWSFGDYFKKEAITWAWELLTEGWGVPKTRLYATVYAPAAGEPATFDQEAYALWEAIFQKAGLDPAIHIVRGTKEDNFWMMGETGPCGPCSEIHLDLTESGDTQGRLVNRGSGHCIEVWNLVFIQFNAAADGSLNELAQPHVDTGMGLERMAGILATTRGFTDFSRPPSNYDSDLFQGLFAHLTKLSGAKYGSTIPEHREGLSKQALNDVIFRVLADHIRTLCFSIADGILPGNEGRNYVLRRILRRAVLFGKRIDLQPGFFAEMVESLVEKMTPYFPELTERQTVIHRVIQSEEQAFDRTLDRGLRLLDRMLAQGQTITGPEAFTLYDTYGFPLDLTQLIARERGISVDVPGFECAMEAQRNRAKAAQKKTLINVAEDSKPMHQTRFVGFDCHKVTGVTTELLDQIEGLEHDFLIVNETPFYAEMGGQIGDTGSVTLGTQTIQVLDTVQDAARGILHKVPQGPDYRSWIGKPIILSIDLERRRQIQRHHSATHLLNFALRQLLGTHIRQAGSYVGTDHLRFDFNHYEALEPEQVQAIENLVNQSIIDNTSICWHEIPYKDKPDEVVAVFGEKYGSVVRVVDIGGYSKELCGGTHSEATGELGFFKITQESAIAAGTRRIEACVGQAAQKLTDDYFNHLNRIARRLSCKPHEANARLETVLQQQQVLEKQMRSLTQQGATEQGAALLENTIERDGLHLLAGQVKDVSPADLKGLAVSLAKKLGPSVVVLGSTTQNKATLVALASPEAIEKDYQAGEIIRTLTAQIGGQGGGKAAFAMGGSPNTTALDDALKRVWKA